MLNQKTGDQVQMNKVAKRPAVMAGLLAKWRGREKKSNPYKWEDIKNEDSCRDIRLDAE